jgi:hypothetical protein
MTDTLSITVTQNGISHDLDVFPLNDMFYYTVYNDHTLLYYFDRIIDNGKAIVYYNNVRTLPLPEDAMIDAIGKEINRRTEENKIDRSINIQRRIIRLRESDIQPS